MDNKTKFNIWYVFIALWGVLIVHALWVRAVQTPEIPYSQFQTYLAEGRIEEIRISQNYIEGSLKDPKEGEPKRFLTVRVEADLAETLGSQKVKFSVRSRALKGMVKAYGMSEKLGRVSFDRGPQPLFLQQGQAQIKEDYSEETAREIDHEVRQIIEGEYTRVTGILTAQFETLQKAAAILLSKETITGEELRAIISQSNGQALGENESTSRTALSS